VNVVLGVERDVVVDDEIDGGDIETSARHVGRQQDVAVTRLEGVERADAPGLGHLAVNRESLEAQISQHQRHTLCSVTRGHEDWTTIKINK
jgi:hypothetical protein